MQLDADFAALLDYLDELGVADNTIVVFSGGSALLFFLSDFPEFIIGVKYGVEAALLR